MSTAAPNYWMWEVSGVLEGPIRRYLNDEVLSPSDISAIRAYLTQWIDAPVWVPYVGALRVSVRKIETAEHIHRWIAAALDEGIDPL